MSQFGEFNALIYPMSCTILRYLWHAKAILSGNVSECLIWAFVSEWIEWAGVGANSQCYLDDKPASTGDGGLTRLNNEWGNNKKEKRNPKRQPDPLFECGMAFDKTLEVTLKNFQFREQDV